MPALHYGESVFGRSEKAEIAQSSNKQEETQHKHRDFQLIVFPNRERRKTEDTIMSKQRGQR